MILLGIAALIASLALLVALVALFVVGGPLVWLGTLVLLGWAAGRAWRWLKVTTPVDTEANVPVPCQHDG